MRIVLDTNVLLSALLTPNRKASAILDKILNGNIEIYYNENIISEYKEVLSRKKFGIPKTQISAIISFIRMKGIYVFDYTESNKPFEDMSDKIFYDIAISKDSILITGNLVHYPKNNKVMSVTEFYNKYI